MSIRPTMNNGEDGGLIEDRGHGCRRQDSGGRAGAHHGGGAAGASEAMKTPHEPSSDYIRFDEIEDVVVSAELVAHLAPLLDTHPSYWKWVIVAAHNAIQGAMVCALADSTGTSVLDESAKKVLDWLNAGMRGDPPDENLASFRRLLNRCTSGPDGAHRRQGSRCQHRSGFRRLHRQRASSARASGPGRLRGSGRAPLHALVAWHCTRPEARRAREDDGRRRRKEQTPSQHTTCHWSARRCRPTQKAHSCDRHHIASAMAELASYLSIVPHMWSFDVPPKHSAPLTRGLFCAAQPPALRERKKPRRRAGLKATGSR